MSNAPENVDNSKVPAQAKSQQDQSSPIMPFTGQQAAHAAAGDQPHVPVDDRRYVRFGLVFLALTLGVFTAWATLAPLGSALVSMGEVVVDSYRKSIQHYEGGIVKDIFVRNGDRVNAGDPLLQLETVQTQADLKTKRKQLFTARAELERLRAEQLFADELVFSQALLDQAQADPDIKFAMAQQKQLFTARLKAYRQERKALQSRVGQIKQQVKGYQEQRRITQARLSSLNKEEKAYATLHNEGLADGQRARELGRQVLSAKNEVARFDSEISRLRIQKTEAELQIATREQDFLKNVGESIKQVQSEYYSLKDLIDVVVDRVNRSTIRAPETGIVVNLKLHTIGSVAASGQVLLDLVPEQDAFVIETRIMTQDINDVYIGQLVDIRFSAFPSRTTKVIEGEVTHISADRLQDQNTGGTYYLLRIAVTEKGRGDMSEEMVLKPGMPAELLIKREERTLYEYLTKPIKDSFARSLKED